MLLIASKKASLSELQQAKEIIFKQLDQIRSSGGLGVPSLSVEETVSNKTYEKAKAEMDELQERFEYLSKHVLDLQANCVSFVPRLEVQDAVKAIVNEVKMLKSSSISHSMFKDALKMKADLEEFNK